MKGTVMPLMKKHKFNIFILLMSLLVTMYMIFFLFPYADQNKFFSVNGMPGSGKVMEYNLFSYPVIIGYFIVVSIFLRKTTFLRFLNYPLFVANIYLGLCFLALSKKGFGMIGIVYMTILFPIVALPVSLLLGIKKDKRYLNKHN
ncbi:hypothetical protein [Paenibacillus alvei]|uniref:Uncharacterized protein n=1 Tax=Paenibacillus alvei TaxID=44250 RepID=A0AAP6ZYT2_PAEAL|nr:hypothetical protein [Paenibacillus alvei]NOJ72191.1 hypothetical protein [Paenibacillus alvei]